MTALQERIERPLDLPDSGKIKRLRGREELLSFRLIAEYLHESLRHAFDLPVNNNTVLQKGVFPQVLRAARQKRVVMFRRYFDHYLHSEKLGLMARQVKGEL